MTMSSFEERSTAHPVAKVSQPWSSRPLVLDEVGVGETDCPPLRVKEERADVPHAHIDVQLVLDDAPLAGASELPPGARQGGGQD